MDSGPHPEEIFDGSAVSEHLPGEPRRDPPPTLRFVARLCVRAVSVVLLALLLAGLWPLYLLGAAIWGWPPNVPRLRQVIRYLRLTWTEQPPAPGLSPLARAWLTLLIGYKCAVTPLWGLCWLLDELLYGRALAAAPVIAPLIEISAGRSGSTQLARYLERDPHLAAPSAAQAVFPYLWLWKIVPGTLGRVLTPDRVRRALEASLPEEFLQRHEGDPFKTDTFEGALYLAHLNHLAPFLGPRILIEDFGFAAPAPHNQALWEEDFVALLDRIGRKVLLYAGPGPDGAPRRLFVKGHFLCAADALSRRYPDARFLTLIRHPAPRLRSAVNFLRANPMDATLGAAPWAWWAQALVRTELDYCDLEQAWFSAERGPRRCVLRFSDYVRDLEGAMSRVYRECLDTPELPAHAPREHEPRVRTNYLLDRTLDQVGIDEAALLQRLSGYVAWCEGQQERGSLDAPPGG